MSVYNPDVPSTGVGIWRAPCAFGDGAVRTAPAAEDLRITYFKVCSDAQLQPGCLKIHFLKSAREVASEHARDGLSATLEGSFGKVGG